MPRRRDLIVKFKTEREDPAVEDTCRYPVEDDERNFGEMFDPAVGCADTHPGGHACRSSVDHPDDPESKHCCACGFRWELNYMLLNLAMGDVELLRELVLQRMTEVDLEQLTRYSRLWAGLAHPERQTVDNFRAAAIEAEEDEQC